MPVARGEGQAGSLGVPGGRLGRASALGRLPSAHPCTGTAGRLLCALLSSVCAAGKKGGHWPWRGYEVPQGDVASPLLVSQA